MYTTEIPHIRTFILSSISSDSVRLIFEKSSGKLFGAAISYHVEQQVKNSADWEVAESSVEPTDDDHIVVMVVTGLQPETQYRFRVVAVINDNGQTFNGIPSEPSVYRKTKSGNQFTCRVSGVQLLPQRGGFTVRHLP